MARSWSTCKPGRSASETSLETLVQRLERLLAFENRSGGDIPARAADAEVTQSIGYERSEIAKVEAKLGLR